MTIEEVRELVSEGTEIANIIYGKSNHQYDNQYFLSYWIGNPSQRGNHLVQYISGEDEDDIENDGKFVGSGYVGVRPVLTVSKSKVQQTSEIVNDSDAKYDAPAITRVGNGSETVRYNNSNDWQLFFEDGEHVYLIYNGAENSYTNDPIYNSKTLSKVKENVATIYPTSVDTNEFYTDYLYNTSRFPAVNKWLTVYKNWLNEDTSRYLNENSMAYALFMLDSNVWQYGTTTNDHSTSTQFYDSEVAEWVIGGPTAEMIVDTLNAASTGSKSNSCYINNNYYTANIEAVGKETVWNTSSSNSYSYYRIACPYGSAEHCCVFGETIGATNFDQSAGYRPVVCLKKGVKLTTVGATNTTYVLTKSH